MIKPTIHLNGTSKESLLDQVTDAREALNAAIGALNNAAPNARDYYPQGDSAFIQATLEHRNRVTKLVAVCNELSDLAEAIAQS